MSRHRRQRHNSGSAQVPVAGKRLMVRYTLRPYLSAPPSSVMRTTLATLSSASPSGSCTAWGKQALVSVRACRAPCCLSRQRARTRRAAPAACPREEYCIHATARHTTVANAHPNNPHRTSASDPHASNTTMRLYICQPALPTPCRYRKFRSRCLYARPSSLLIPFSHCICSSRN